jgi:CheY-like chemotaxis protein
MMRAPHILVIEDSDEDFETLLDAVRCVGVQHEIRRATSGDDGLQLLQKAAEHGEALPVLVLLDLNTPRGDGRVALQDIKQNEQLRLLPLVVLSGSANPRDLEFCYANSANAYHVKPLSYADHLKVLEYILGYWLTCVRSPNEPFVLSLSKDLISAP